VRFVDYNKVICAPIQGIQLKPVDVSGFAREVSMMKYVVSEFVIRERIKGARVTIDGPIAAQLFRAKDKDPLVAKFEIFDNRKSSVGLTEAHTVGKNATVVI